MNAIVKFFLQRPVLVSVVGICVFGYGILSMFKMRKEGFPEVAMNRVVITTIYPGSSPLDVEMNITTPIEDRLQEIDGIKEFSSASNEGISLIDVVMDDDASPGEVKEIYAEIDAAISNIKDFPADLTIPPLLDQVSSLDAPVVEIALTGPSEQVEKHTIHLAALLEKSPGVARADIVGFGDRELQILVDPDRARTQYVDLKMIARAIQNRNLQGSGGTLESFLGEKKIVSYSKYRSPDDILNTSIRRSFGGRGVRLRDVAELKEVPEDLNLRVRNNGGSGASILIVMRGNNDIIRTVDGVRKVLENTPAPQGITYRLLNDRSKLTRERLALVASNALIGFVLVGFILYFILDLKTSFWTAFGIPFSLMGVFTILYLFGYTLNVLTLGGFIIVIGMLVDDAVVVAEEINSLREQGMTSFDAAVNAVGNVWQPVLSSALTTMIAFMPLLSLGGLPGKFIWLIPLVVILSLFVSLLESFLILPAHLGHGRSFSVEKKEFIRVAEDSYRRILRRVMRHRYKTIALFVSLLIVSFLFIVFFLKKDPFPQDSSEGITMQLTFPQGASLDYSENKIKRVESVLNELPGEELIGYSARIGTHSKNPATERGNMDHVAVIFVYLTSYEERSRTASAIAAELRKKISKALLPEGSEVIIELIRIGPPMGRAFEIRVSSKYNRLREEKVAAVKEFVRGIPGILEVDDDRIPGKNEINLLPEFDLVAETGISVADLLFTLRAAFDGVILSNITTEAGTRDIRLRLNEPARADSAFLDKLPLINRMGNMLRLTSLVQLEENSAQGEIRHINGIRTVTVFGNLDNRLVSPEEVMRRVASAYPGDQNVMITYSGQPEETKKIFKDLKSAAIAALLGIYLVIALIFGSFLRPFVVLAGIPFILVGVTFALVIHSLPVSIFTGMALIGLMGVIVNGSIVLVHTSMNLPTNGSSENTPIVEGAVSRFRPVLVTALTTILGLLPTAYSLGGYDPFITPMCIALVYGLGFGTVVVLFLIPILLLVEQDLLQAFQLLRQKGKKIIKDNNKK